MKIPFLFLLVWVPFSGFCMENRLYPDSVKFRVNFAVKAPYTSLAHDPYFLLGAGMLLTKTELQLHYMRSLTLGTNKPEMRHGISIQYLHHFNKPYSRLRLGCFFEYGIGQFYFSLNDGSSISSRDYVPSVKFVGPAIEITLFRNRKVDLNFKYNSGMSYWRMLRPYQAIGLDISLKR